jgi:hypothetical protein
VALFIFLVALRIDRILSWRPTRVAVRPADSRVADADGEEPVVAA